MSHKPVCRSWVSGNNLFGKLTGFYRKTSFGESFAMVFADV